MTDEQWVIGVKPGNPHVLIVHCLGKRFRGTRHHTLENDGRAVQPAGCQYAPLDGVDTSYARTLAQRRIQRI